MEFQLTGFDLQVQGDLIGIPGLGMDLAPEASKIAPLLFTRLFIGCLRVERFRGALYHHKTSSNCSRLSDQRNRLAELQKGEGSVS